MRFFLPKFDVGNTPKRSEMQGDDMVVNTYDDDPLCMY